MGVVLFRAGIGRTGTFIASNYLRDLLERDGRVDVHKFVWQLRAQRKKFVQKVCQYRFIHQALLEHILFTRSRLTLSNILNSSFGTTTATGVTGVTPPHSIKANILQQLQVKATPIWHPPPLIMQNTPYTNQPEFSSNLGSLSLRYSGFSVKAFCQVAENRCLASAKAKFFARYFCAKVLTFLLTRKYC